jgi:hypothetical protein
MAHGSSLRLHYEEEEIVAELTSAKNWRWIGCFGLATTNGGVTASVVIEGALRVVRRSIRGGN